MERWHFENLFSILSFISGITLLGLPTEIYSFGIQYLYVIGGVISMGIVMGSVFLPVFHALNITSTYEVIVAFVLFRLYFYYSPIQFLLIL